MVLITPEATPASLGSRLRVATLYTGVHTQPIPRPLMISPGRKAQRPESACATQSMYATPAASNNSHLPLTFCTMLLATTVDTIIASGCGVDLRPLGVHAPGAGDFRRISS